MCVFHVYKEVVNVKGLHGFHLALKMWESSGCNDDATLTQVPGGQSVNVNIRMKNMTL